MFSLFKPKQNTIKTLLREVEGEKGFKYTCTTVTGQTLALLIAL